MTNYYERHGKYAAAAWHRRFLRNAYRRTYEALENLGCSPLTPPRPRVLLCGVGAPATAVEFAAFLCARQLSTRLFVVDVALPPLVASLTALEAQSALTDVTLVCADARALPFSDGSFDLVETDFLLQFLAPPDRRLVLHEWARVLRREGGLMTRDWVTHERGLRPSLGRTAPRGAERYARRAHARGQWRRSSGGIAGSGVSGAGASVGPFATHTSCCRSCSRAWQMRAPFVAPWTSQSLVTSLPIFASALGQSGPLTLPYL